MIGKSGMKGISTAAVCAAAICIALTTSGCEKLKARDHLNQGVNAFKTGNYSQAADEFHLAIDADPTFGVARLYLATALEQQWVPGTETPQNKKFYDAAMQEFNTVLANSPDQADRLLATQSLASLYYQAGNNAKGDEQADLLAKAEDWNKKVIALDPKNKEAYYTLGVIYWDEFVTPDRELRNADGMKLEDKAPLKPDAKGKTAKADLKAKYYGLLTQGLEDEKKALEIDPNYEEAMDYMELLTLYRADLDDTKDQYDADARDANNWMDKALETKKANAAKKAAAAEAGAPVSSQ
jgi:tetratricopeptide (TPR) repeat protein